MMQLLLTNSSYVKKLSAKFERGGGKEKGDKEREREKEKYTLIRQI